MAGTPLVPPLNLSYVLAPWGSGTGTGPQGPAGPQGAAGSIGPQGPQGAQGASASAIVQKLGSGIVNVGGSGTSRVGPFTRTAGWLPWSTIRPTVSGSGRTWGGGPFVAGEDLDYNHHWIDNAEANNQLDGSLIIENNQSAQDIIYGVWQGQL